MKRNFHQVIQVVAFLMLVIGLFMFVFALVKSIDAGKGYYTRDPVSQVIWGVIAAQSLATAVGSVFVYGFSFIVKAACTYLEKQEGNDHDYTETEE